MRNVDHILRHSFIAEHHPLRIIPRMPSIIFPVDSALIAHKYQSREKHSTQLPIKKRHPRRLIHPSISNLNSPTSILKSLPSNLSFSPWKNAFVCGERRRFQEPQGSFKILPGERRGFIALPPSLTSSIPDPHFI